MQSDNQPLTKGEFQTFKEGEFNGLRSEFKTFTKLFDTVATSIKEDFNRIEDKMETLATKDDLKNALNNYPTKDDLKNELSKYATKDDMIQFKSDILDSNDHIIKLLENKKTEDAGLGANVTRHETTLRNHGRRIRKLETGSLAA